MATGQEHFALDWIKSELFETLNSAREALEAYVESAEGSRDETRMRACLTGLHQVHGTLVMLELQGITLLADHLERLAQEMLNGSVNATASSQTLMQGILELPGHIDEIQQGRADSPQSVLRLVNEVRSHLGEQPLAEQSEVASIDAVASEASIERFEAIDGVGKVRKIRGAYQQVLLSILKGEDHASSMAMLGKVAQGLERVCEGTPHGMLWQAFTEFVGSLKDSTGVLPSDVVKLLRRIDSEIRALAQDGTNTLRKPVSSELVELLLDAARQRGRESAIMTELAGSLQEVGDAGGLLISGRQALSSAAGALREELALVKDQLDLSVRAERGGPEDLVTLVAPLKQIGSTLSLLGFESSRTIVSDQVEVLNQATEGHVLNQGTLLSVASALVQVDENLASFTQGGKGEAEKITDDAHRAVTTEARQGLEQVKQSVVDFIASQWDPRHLEQVGAQLDSICGALDMIPLPRASRQLASCGRYIASELTGERTPSWEELDHLADAVSGVDYFLERLGEENSVGAEDILDLVQRSLDLLGIPDSPGVVAPAATDEAPAATHEAPAATDEETAATDEETAATDEAPAAIDEETAVTEETAVGATPAATGEPEPAPGKPTADISAGESAPASSAESGIEDEEEEEPRLEMDDDPGFDLDNLAAAGGTSEPGGLAEASEPEVMASTPAPPTNPSLVDSFESDAEIIEIFVEEVDEVLETIAGWLPQLEADLGNEEALSEVRRAFHTLKGSGRIVGANIIGELAWSVENMLNRVIDGTVTATAQFVVVVDQARGLVPELRDAFETKATPAMDGLGTIMERADVLASGGSLEEAASVPVEEPPAEVSTPDPLQVFATEAQTLLQTLQTVVSESELVLNEAALRSLHTLAGSAGMAGIDAVAELARPVYELAQALRLDTDRILEGEQAAFFRRAINALQENVADLVAGNFPEGHPQLIADADHLLIDAARMPERTEHTQARDLLLGLEGLSTVMDAQEFLRNWQAGAMDLEYSEQLHSALLDVSRVAQEVDRPGIGELAEVLAAVHEFLADDLLTDTSAATLDAGHERLLGMFDALASDETLPGIDDVTAELRALIEEAEATLEDADLPVAEGMVEESAEVLEDATAQASLEDDATAGDDAAQESTAAEVVGPTEVGAQEVAGLTDTTIGDATRKELGDTSLTTLGAADDVEVLSDEQSAVDSDNVVAFPGSGGSDDAPVDSGGDVSLEELTDELLKDLKSDAGAGPHPDATEVGSTGAEEAPAGSPVTADLNPADLNPAVLDPAIADLLPEDLDEEIIEVFFEEADEIVESLDENIHQWSSEPGNRLYLEHLLRGLHTLKGGARLAGLTRLGDVTHDFESFVVDVQTDSKAVGAEFFAALNRHFDDLTTLLGVVKAALAGEAVSMPSVLSGAPADVVPAEPESPTGSEPASAPVSSPEADVVPPVLTTSVDAEPAVEAPVPLQASARSDAPATQADDAGGTGQGKETDKTESRTAQEMVRVGSGLLENLVNLAGESSIVRARIEQGMSDFMSSLDEMETTIERVREQLRRLEIETETQILFRSDRPDGPKYDDFDPLEMDRYSQLQQLSRGLSESASDMLDLKDSLLFKARESETLLLQQARINTELQEGLMRTRMVPFSRLLPRLRRIVRQIAGELGKEVEFHAYNAEGELDRNLLERMVPPLEHMLRNAVDHGIESKELRKNYGKPASGRIDLRLSREGGDVVIEIGDDGGGIDVETVRAKAVERGLMAEGAVLRDDEISQFVLAPGFSTAKSVTQISGRGVGMDVVHSEVKQLGGSIQIASRPGKGTRFIVRVPFTVSVNRALMVSVGEDLYAIPLNTIEGIVLLSPDELEQLYAPDGNTFEYAGIPYRVRYLGHYLGREFRASALQSSVPVVLVRSGDQAVAVHVDGVQGSREIVVKSLGPQFAGVGGISGATILGDGSVVVIIDLLALIRAQSSGGSVASKRPLTGASRTRCVMVVDDSVTVRKVTSRLLERQGMDVMVAKDGIEAISILQERRPDIMLLDIEMPRMDGFEVARQVRHDDRLGDLPIVMISSRTGEKHQEHAAQLGVNSFLGKPFQENELLEIIDQLVD